MAKQPGVFNPYGTIEKSVTEPTTPPNTSIRLDGDAFILELMNIRIEEIPGRLGMILQDVNKNHAAYLIQNGIELRPTKEPITLEEDELVLPTPQGHLVVYVGKGGQEIDAFRRIGFVLHKLPVSDILRKHEVNIITRM